MMDAQKPGYLTSEFYVTLLFTLNPVFTKLFGHDVSASYSDWSVIIAAVVGAVYIIGRTVVKHTAIKKNAEVEQTTIATAVNNPDPVV